MWNVEVVGLGLLSEERRGRVDRRVGLRHERLAVAHGRGTDEVGTVVAAALLKLRCTPVLQRPRCGTLIRQSGVRRFVADGGIWGRFMKGALAMHRQILIHF